ncbi:MAG TPA: glycogen-binding domain-containing protein [Verrucomicrobiae bacterium]|nr:glycogen-binding domain-containing protein [Verrucomicrobiae bacterium]
MKRLFLAFGILSLGLALITGCASSSPSQARKSSTNVAPAAPPETPQAAPPPPAASVYTPPVAVSPSEPAATSEQNRVVEFKIKAPDASKAYLAGEFNDWSETALPMTKQTDGVWMASVALKPGRYQYKFIVDDKWTPDPDNPDQTDDGYGGSNSVVNVPEPGNSH